MTVVAPKIPTVTTLHLIYYFLVILFRLLLFILIVRTLQYNLRILHIVRNKRVVKRNTETDQIGILVLNPD